MIACFPLISRSIVYVIHVKLDQLSEEQAFRHTTTMCHRLGDCVHIFTPNSERGCCQMYLRQGVFWPVVAYVQITNYHLTLSIMYNYFITLDDTSMVNQSCVSSGGSREDPVQGPKNKKLPYLPRGRYGIEPTIFLSLRFRNFLGEHAPGPL